jgi:alpha-maltose-1-phosphate synthase
VKILFGHPTGNPNSHQAALAHFEAGRLDAFCVSWMPTPREIQFLKRLPGLKELAARLDRRIFPPIFGARIVQEKSSEWGRILRRLLIGGPITDEAMAYHANDWLMRTMARECERASVTAVHAYEDCSLLQFQAARKLGKACIYDMPIGFYPAWEEMQRSLAKQFAEWVPSGGLHSDRYVRPAQKKQEMELADLVIGPSTFVDKTIRAYFDKRFALAPYGVDSDFWCPGPVASENRPLRFIYAGQASIRKGTPLLLQAWEAAALKEAELVLVGNWQLASGMQRHLPAHVVHVGPCSSVELRARYRSADIFVFPSYFEGFGLVLLEAMACGLPVLATERTAAPDILSEESGSVVAAGDLDAWVEALRVAGSNRDRLPNMRKAARAAALKHSWKNYRDAVSTAVSTLAA